MDGNDSSKDELHKALMFFHSSMPTAETWACLLLSSCDMTCEQPPWLEVGTYETAEERFVHKLFKEFSPSPHQHFLFPFNPGSAPNNSINMCMQLLLKTVFLEVTFVCLAL